MQKLNISKRSNTITNTTKKGLLLTICNILPPNVVQYHTQYWTYNKYCNTVCNTKKYCNTYCNNCNTTILTSMHLTHITRDATLAQHMLCSCVNLSVILYVTSRCSINTAKHASRKQHRIIVQGQQGLHFLLPRVLRNSNGITPNKCAKHTSDWKNLWLSAIMSPIIHSKSVRNSLPLRK